MNPYAVRFLFGAGVSVIGGVVTDLHGFEAGGVLLAFPAVLPATLTLLERDRGTVAAVSDARGAVLGALALVPFAVVVITLERTLPPAVALVVALVTWTAAALLLYGAGTALARLLGLQRYPPEVPVGVAEPLVDALRRARLSIAIADAGAGGALAAVISEVPGVSAVLQGAFVSSDWQHAALLLGVEGIDGAGERGAIEFAGAARRLTGAAVGLAMVGTNGDRPAVWEDVFVGVTTPAGDLSCRERLEHGPEGNWGQAVHIALRLARQAVERG